MLQSLHLLFIIAQQQTMPAGWWVPLIQGGGGAAVSGAMVVWFAFRAEKILERIRAAMERNTNALMIAVLHARHLDDAIKPLAEKIERDSAEAFKDSK